jgi:peptide deformylase
MKGNRKTKKIITFGDHNLRATCSKIENFNKKLKNEIDIIYNTLKLHGEGAALAAPQISLLKQIIVIDYLGEYFELINPEIAKGYGETNEFEGCLSLPGLYGQVKRYEKIRVKFQNRNGQFYTVDVENQMARCFQHEIDHLSGTLYIDRMTDKYVFNSETNGKIPVKFLLELAGKRIICT